MIDAPAPGRVDALDDMAARPTLVEVQLVLGQMHLDRREPTAALEWFRSAARGGDARAFNMLGRCHERGWGVRPSPATAARYYRKAADRGDVWALFNLADLHCRGEGVPQDDATAYALYAAAARRGHVKSLNMLGLFHECGRAVPADVGEAADFFRAAAEGGDCWGCFNHARTLIANGEIEAALIWFERAFHTGFSQFYRAMGEALAGLGDPRLSTIAARSLALAEHTAGDMP
ncbi:tetratricopeptide repeat protein [Xanthobacter oligotrophicus]|uniref:Tetratricopeptide repeat protein n=1 Tax=Xanthobacter oligotrophicus TaxID=2607286 RepID=A0ABW7A242_9HYPH